MRSIFQIIVVQTIALMFAAAGAANSGSARADVFELKNGGRIEGQLAGQQDANATDFVISTVDGGRMTIAKSEVTRVVPQSKDEAEHQRRARADIMAARGLVLYEGKYVTRQHVELLERDKQARSSDADWNNRIDRLRKGLTGRRQDRADQALAELRAIRDPQAAAAIADWLRHEQDPELKRILLETAARIDHPLTVNALVELSLTDADEETRAQALEYLIRSGRPGITGPYIRALKNADDLIVNHAAEALQTIGDADAIGPLIDALITKHKTQTSGGSPDQHAYVFTPNGGGVSSFGSAPPKVITEAVRNPYVLTALVKLSGGASFDYDQEQWRNWLLAQVKSHAVDVRRDQ